ncbi:unnamed protein product [Thlaspi arvense]|uniref:DUF577 domain-containing protein n=1 Tax=Thlaspi arvense TaxID=13288 RepID=A0AAU9T905_THLAR|nr:unnamed protein product [Thlaspi arvense]
MAESSNLWLKARDILATPRHERLTIIVDQLYTPKESVEYKSALALCDFCVANFPNCLTQMLLKAYRYSSDEVTSFRSLLLLSETLTEIRSTRGFVLSIVALNDIKQLLISCLTIREANKFVTRTLRIIVSYVAFNVVMLDSDGWDELGDCMFTLANTDPFRAFSVFIDLPPLYGGFTNRFLHKLREEVYKVLLHPQRNQSEEWTFALETAIKLAFQLLDSGLRIDLTREILDTVLNSARVLVGMGMEEFLQNALESLVKFLERDAKSCKWSTKQCGFVAEFAFKIARIGTKTKETAKKIYQMVTIQDKYVENTSFKLRLSRFEKNQDRDLGDDRDLYHSFTKLSPFDILAAFAVAEYDDSTREVAIRRLHDVLCDHTSGKWYLDISEIEKLNPLLVRCLRGKRIPEKTFMVLGQVVFHVALETFSYTDDPWFDLWDYIASQSKAEFSKAVYIFQCLTMRFDDKEDVVIHAMNSLLPEIYKRLNPPRELLVDNSIWVLAFTGAFCAAIRLINIASHAGFVREIAEKMVDSVRELVERGMEVGLVMRAFRDVEGTVEKQWDWYKTCEYRFVKGLLWKLYGINGMKMESKMVLWRINGNLDRSVKEVFKRLSETELDWLNQP